MPGISGYPLGIQGQCIGTKAREARSISYFRMPVCATAAFLDAARAGGGESGDAGEEGARPRQGAFESRISSS